MSTIAPTELRQILRAYTRQLKKAYTKDEAAVRVPNKRNRGFEKVDISPEARELATTAASESSKSETKNTSKKEIEDTPLDMAGRAQDDVHIDKQSPDAASPPGPR
ncbi:MAG: hypothetical protein QNJ97_16975 [Myxococcota bacterium]|nr:hypothetical protein [Myxococcota bacterium]